MKAISVIQPWASLLAIYNPITLVGKRFETRVKQFPAGQYRGPVAIHASKKKPEWDTIDPEIAEKMQDDLWHHYQGVPLPVGAIVGVADITAVIKSEKFRPWPTSTKFSGKEYYYGNFEPERIAIDLGENRRVLLNPIPIMGALGLWSVPDDIAAKLVRT